MAARAAELLSASVVVVDEHGLVLARGQTTSPASPELAGDHQERDACVSAPAVIGGRPCMLVVERSSWTEGVSLRLARTVLELVISQAAFVDRLPNQIELKNKFIHDLLHDTIEDENSTRREGQILGIDLTRPRAAILIDAADYILPARDLVPLSDGEQRSQRSALRTRRVIATIVRFFRLPNDAICAYIGDGEVAVLKASATQDLAAWAEDDGTCRGDPSWANLAALKRAGCSLLDQLQRETGGEISIGIGRYHAGIRGLARSYADARAALSIGSRICGAGQLYSLDSLGVAAFAGVSDEATKLALARHLLSPLDQEPELIETLRVFFAQDCSPSLAAGCIPVHRNTLAYRLDKIASLTGLDPRRFDDAVQLRLALVLRSLSEKRQALPNLRATARTPAERDFISYSAATG